MLKTALSQCHNLYFVVYGDEIHVYRPSFPQQELRKQEFEWRLASSGSGRPGDIDKFAPHHANNMIISDLGYEEVLVCACDDGDVVGYATFLVSKALEAVDSGVLSAKEATQQYIRPLFVRNCGRSAWGLALHKNARLLAVGSNNHVVKVYGFALDQETDDEEVVTEIDASRAEDWEQTLVGHCHNIPCIAFYNTDHTGRFLASIDILGTVFIWDVLKGRPLRHIHLPSNNTGWSIHCINPESFRWTDSYEEFLGCNLSRGTKHGSYNISLTRLDVTDSSPWHPSFTQNTPQIPIAGNEDMTGIYLDDEDDSEDTSEMEFDNEDHDEINAGLVNDSERAELQMSANIFDCWAFLETDEAPPFELFITTKLNAYLIRPPFKTFTTICEAPLVQHRDPLAHFERLNMSIHVPELRAVIVGCQTGRVGVFSLTRKRRTSDRAFRIDWILPFKSQESLGQRPNQPLIGLAVAPVQGREAAIDGIGGDSPDGSNVGMWKAVEQKRRFRIILTYYDNSVLSYEIGRQSWKGRGGNEGTLLVI